MLCDPCVLRMFFTLTCRWFSANSFRIILTWWKIQILALIVRLLKIKKIHLKKFLKQVFDAFYHQHVKISTGEESSETVEKEQTTRGGSLIRKLMKRVVWEQNEKKRAFKAQQKLSKFSVVALKPKCSSIGSYLTKALLDYFEI